MNKYIKSSLVMGLSTLAVVGCSDDDDSNSAPVSDDQLLSYIEDSNYSLGFPNLMDESDGSQLTQRGVVRFDTSSQIPLFFVSNGGQQPPASIQSAISTIEARLGDIFTDFQLIDHDLTVYRDDSRTDENVGNHSYDETLFKAMHPEIVGGLIINEGAAYYDAQYSSNPANMCANASIGPYTGSIHLNVYDNTHTYVENTLFWVNMGNGNCSWGSDMVVHEIAHAMGMFSHIDHSDFGLWGSTAMNMLATMYSNPAGTPYHSLIPSTD